MKERNKYLSLVAIFLVLGLTIASCYPRMKAQPKIESYFVKKLDKTAAKLNLSSEQEAEFGKLKAEIRQNFQEGRTKKQEVLRQIKAEGAQEQPDIMKMTRLLQEVFDDEANRINGAFDLMIVFTDRLNETQKGKLIEMISAWVSKWD